MKHLMALGVVVLLAIPSVGQLTIYDAAPQNDVSFLVPQVMEVGGLTSYNHTFIGDAKQIGRFTHNGLGLPFTDGVILSTGDINVALGPDNSTNADLPHGSSPGAGDADLDALAGLLSSDAAIIEFDFEPTGDTVWIQYAFASEEYDELVCSGLVDHVGIFLSGPGINGPYSNNAINLAVAPGTTLPVSVNSINSGMVGSNGQVGGCYGAGDPGLNQSAFYQVNQDSAFVQFDGWTLPLVAGSAVQCNESYHLKIVLARGGGQNGESALLLSADGLGSNGLNAQAGYTMGDTAIVEGCHPLSITFDRPVGSGLSTLNLHFAGDAINGVDYTNLDSTVIFPTGQDSVTITFDVLADGLTEGEEELIIWYAYLNPCGVWDTVTFNYTILDEYTIQATLSANDQTICEGESVILTGTGAQGNGPYQYFWNDVAGPAVNTVSPTTTTTYQLIVFDQAGCADSKQVTIDVYSKPHADAGPDRQLCLGSPVSIGQWIDGGSGATYSWVPPTGLDNTSSAYPTLTPMINSTYSVTVTTAQGCTANGQFSVTVFSSPTAWVGPDQSITYGDYAIISGGGSTTLSWSPTDGLSCTDCPTPQAAPTQTTDYTITASNQWGCSSTATLTVDVFVPEEVFVPTGFSPNGDGFNDILYVRGYTLESFEFQVFDQWGQRIFKSIDPYEGWDGNIGGGNPAPTDVYTWVLSGRFVNGVETTLSGSTTLVR